LPNRKIGKPSGNFAIVIHRLSIWNGRNTMPATHKIAAAAAIAVLIAPTLGSAQALNSPRQAGPSATSAISGAHAAASKSSRTVRPAQRSRVSRSADASAGHILTQDGRDMGTDPDAAIRFQLRRDYSSGGM